MKDNCYVFWRRIFAFMTDAVMLGIIGRVLGALFSHQLYELSFLGRLIGFLFWVIYFGLFNSVLFKGQTIGKKLFQIKVVNTHGEYLHVDTSFLRAVIFFLPGIFNGMQFPLYMIISLVYYLACVIIVMFGINIIYLFLFNLPTRQSLHDLTVKSYVVHADCTQNDFSEEKTKKIHYIIMATIAVIAVLLPLFVYANFAPTLKTIRDTSKIIKEEFKVDVIGAEENYNYSTEKGKTMSLDIVVRNKDLHNNYENKKLILGIVKTILEKYPKSMNFDLISVTLTRNYDIWISRRMPYFKVTFTPGKWLKYLKDTK